MQKKKYRENKMFQEISKTSFIRILPKTRGFFRFSNNYCIDYIVYVEIVDYNY